VPIWNPPRTVEAAVDKYLSLAMLAAAGLPVPATWTGQSAAGALAAFDALGGDVVVKPLFGSEGRGLIRLSERELAWRAFHALERLDSVIYVQRMIRHPGHDVRAFVLQGRVLGAQIVGAWLANDLVRAYLAAEFSTDPDCRRRVSKLADLERASARELLGTSGPEAPQR
jgi:glutathione synthase/RimK-type ligase-like ATP-grasp enzyme